MIKKKTLIVLSIGLTCIGIFISLFILAQNNIVFWRTILLTKKNVTNKGKIIQYTFKDFIGMPAPTADLGTFTVNLLGDSGERKLMVQIEVGLSDNMGFDEIDKKFILIQDSLITLLSNKCYQDIADDWGKMNLKAEINRAKTELNLIDELFDIADLQRLTGNDYAHPSEETPIPNESDLNDFIGWFEQLVHFLIIGPAKREELRAKRS